MSQKKVAGLHSYKDKRTGKTYYSCIHPKTGKRHGLGTHFHAAVKVLQRIQLKYHTDIEQRMFNRIEGEDKTINNFIPHYKKSLSERGLSDNTMRTRNYVIDSVVAPILGNMQIADVDVLDVNNIIEDYKGRQKNRMAQVVRSALIDFFIEAISTGWTTNNPAANTRQPRASVKRARFTLDTFKQVYELASDEWVKRAMELALVTSHAGASELATMQQPKDGFLWIERTKTQQRIKIPLELTLEKMGWNLGEIIKSCQSTGIHSPYLLHHTINRKQHEKGDKMHPYRITRAITALVRKSGINWETKAPPTLYEIRSLSERLYRVQGVDVQTLLGHKTARSTEVYDDERGGWKELKL